MVRDSAEILISSGLAAAGALLSILAQLSLRYLAHIRKAVILISSAMYAGYKYFNLDGEAQSQSLCCAMGCPH